MQDDTRWVRITEAAEQRKCSVRTIRRMISAGTIRAERFGPRIILVSVDSLNSAGKTLQYTGGDVA